VKHGSKVMPCMAYKSCQTTWKRLGTRMGSITISKLDDDLESRLRLRAARHGRTTEDEVRDILQEALSGPVNKPNYRDLGERIHARFAAVGGLELQQSRSSATSAAKLFK
jgi:antitoxin FitA